MKKIQYQLRKNALTIGVSVFLSMSLSLLFFKYAFLNNPGFLLDAIKANPKPFFEGVQEIQKLKFEEEQLQKKAALRVKELNQPVQPNVVGRAAKPGSLPGAPVTIVIYSNFQCPQCALITKRIDELMALYPEKLQVYYKHAPGDKLSFDQARVFEAFALQDPYAAWKVHNYMFKNRALIRGGGIDLLYAELRNRGYDINRLKADMLSQTVRDAIRIDNNEISEFKIKFTPTGFINGVRLVGGVPLNEYKQLIDLALLKNQIEEKK